MEGASGPVSLSGVRAVPSEEDRRCAAVAVCHDRLTDLVAISWGWLLAFSWWK